MTSRNALYYGDNLPILREYIPAESVDLIYLDPAFNSQRTYNVLFKQESGRESEAQITAFEDTWHWAGAAATSWSCWRWKWRFQITQKRTQLDALLNEFVQRQRTL